MSTASGKAPVAGRRRGEGGVDGIDAVLALDSARTMAEVQSVVRAIAAPLGYDRYLVFTVTLPQDRREGRIYWIEGDWFGDGRDVEASEYLRHCPVSTHMLERDEPFFWSKRPDPGGPRYLAVDRPRGEGPHGLQIPVFGRAGLEGAVSLGGVRIDASAHARAMLEQVGAHAFRAARRCMSPGEAPSVLALSSREREILGWIAAGRRHADIAAALHLSERTVENHLRNIRQRLGVATTAHAVRIALLNGEIAV